MGETAKSMRLKEQVAAHPTIALLNRVSSTASGFLIALRNMVGALDKKLQEHAEEASYPTEVREARAVAKRAHRVDESEKAQAEEARSARVRERWRSSIMAVIMERDSDRKRVTKFTNLLREINRHVVLKKLVWERYVRRKICRECRALVCTIDSVGKMMDALQHCGLDMSERRLHSVIVDEAGCVLEPSLLLLLRLKPENMLLVGDPRQLRPFSRLKDSVLNHDRSLLERAEADGLRLHVLQEQ
jgi:hypothetical protein